MSQVVPLPPQPVSPKHSGRFVFGVLLLVALLAVSVIFEVRLLNSGAAREAAGKIRGDSRVRADFGDDVHIPVAVGLSSGNQARIYAYVTGKLASGYALVDMQAIEGPWKIFSLEVHNQSEHHLIGFASPKPAAKPEQLQGSGNLYFVALGDAASADVSELVTFFNKEFGISIKTLAPIPLPAVAYDPARKQWIAEMLVQSMAASFPDIAADPDSRIVGVLEDDLYIRNFGWDYTYSYRHRGKYSVVPAARLDPTFNHLPTSPAIRTERLRKVAMKAVGLLYLGFAESGDPQSVDAVEYTVEDIDRMGSVYLASDVRTGPDTNTASTNTDGTPCLAFFAANLSGTPLRKPVVQCGNHGDDYDRAEYHIDLARGKFESTRVDLFRGGLVPLALRRMNFSYHFDDKIRAFGKSSWQNLDDTVWSTDPDSIQTISIYGVQFQRVTPGSGFSTLAKYHAGPKNGDFSNALLSWENNGWRIDTWDGGVWHYLSCTPRTPVPCYFMGQRDHAGDSIEVTRDPSNGHIRLVTQKTFGDLPAATQDHTWRAVYDGEKISEIDDSDGAIVRYRYDHDEFLTDVDSEGHTVHYDYNDDRRITTVIEDGRALRIQYDSEGRVNRVDFQNGSTYTIKYLSESVEVAGPDHIYTVTILPSFFRTVEHK